MQHNINDTGLRIVGISLLSALILLPNEQFQQPLTKQGVALILFKIASVALIWHLNRAITVHFRYTALPRATIITRIGITLLFCIVATTLFTWAFDALRYAVMNGTLTNFRANERPAYLVLGSRTFQMTTYGMDFFHAIFTSSFYVTIYQLVFYRQDSSRYQRALAQSEQEREKLRVANMQSQLDVLKQQVNPHFLFNSLNTLSYLIGEDSEKAEDFLNELCKVYRYLLRSNEHELTDLNTELQFIQSYFHLLKTRYGDSLQLKLAIEPQSTTCLLPSLTLQLLIENAVKHNIIDKTQPLMIEVITQPGNLLMVKNNLQKKLHLLPSTQIGLRNIATKFRLLNQGDIRVQETDDEFVVTIPLIAAGTIIDSN